MQHASLILLCIAFAVIVFTTVGLWLKLTLLAAGAILLGMAMWREGGKRSVASLRIVSIILFLFVVNVLAKYYERVYDLTADQIYTLSPQTVEVLGKLVDDIEVIGFFKTPSQLGERFQRFMERATGASPHVQWQTKDPDTALNLATRYGINKYETVVLVQGEQWVVVDNFTEEEFVNGLWRLLRRTEKAICWSTGESEASHEAKDAEGMSQLATTFEQMGYQLTPLFFPSLAAIPDQCYFVAIMGPRSSFHPASLDLIESFLLKGGRLLLLLDPHTTTGIEPYLERWGFLPLDALIADEESRFEQGESTIPLTKNYVQSPLTAGLGTYTFFPLVRPLNVRPDPPEGFTYHYLVLSSPQSWAETNWTQFPPLYQEREDPRGPHGIALLVDFPGGGQLGIIGDSDFVRNAYVEKAANKDLIVNMAKWLARDEAYITIAPRQRRDSRLDLTPAQTRLVKVSAFYLLPGGAFLLCFVGWWRRVR